MGRRCPGVGIWMGGAAMLAAVASLSCQGVGTIPIAFRYDDFSSKSDTQLEQQIFALFERYGIPCTVAVIPDVCEGAFEDATSQNFLPLSNDKATMLRDGVAAGTLEVAQHGLTHQAQTTDGTTRSEFRGLSYDQQSQRIASGKAMLEQAVGQTVKVFVPPWDTYDDNTVRALGDLGFACLSADAKGVKPEGAKLVFVAETSDLDTIQLTVNGKRIGYDGVPVVVLFHEYDFQESNPTAKMNLERFEQMLSWVKHQSILRTRTVGQIADELDNHVSESH